MLFSDYFVKEPVEKKDISIIYEIERKSLLKVGRFASFPLTFPGKGCYKYRRKGRKTGCRMVLARLFRMKESHFCVFKRTKTRD
mgnify:FL=1